MAKNKFTLDRTTLKVMNGLKNAMALVAIESENHFKQNFRKQGFEVDNGIVQKWRPRKRSTKQDRRTRRNRAILVQTGALRNSIQRNRVNAYKYKVVSDLPYSAIHNDGGMGLAWGKHKFRMARRKYMGYSRSLIRKNTRTFVREINKAFNA